MSEQEHYRGAQWKVTDYGIEAIDGSYEIHRGDLSMDVGDGGWVGHMSEKTWVDMEDFKRAFEIARRVHQ